ncbi:MAG: hypothetical protein A2Z13_03800 [Deltaproteobacteria bacterium RBG_16_64_85]|nr:MAG: hypothetical protein A2Z13_03800 [Deltaproteobacteria bacterium RBG_16_64_85]
MSVHKAGKDGQAGEIHPFASRRHLPRDIGGVPDGCDKPVINRQCPRRKERLIIQEETRGDKKHRDVHQLFLKSKGTFINFSMISAACLYSMLTHPREKGKKILECRRFQGETVARAPPGTKGVPGFRPDGLKIAAG